MLGKRSIAILSKILSKILRGISRDSTQLLPSDVRPSEALSTFVTRIDQVNRKTNTIRHNRLMPRRNKRKNDRLETSVCRSASLSDAEVWAICAKHFDTAARDRAIGRGVGPASAVFGVDLKLEADGIPYREHANIVGWHDSPGIPDNELKHFWMEKAQIMAPGFKYVPR